MVKTIALAAMAFVVVGLIGHSDMQFEQMQAESDMIHTCEYSARVMSGQLENACGEMIDKVQSDGHHEVLSKNGTFWVEKH